MGKKRTPVFRDGSDRNDDRNNGKIKAINTWNDIEHDSEDDFHDEREKVLLNDAKFGRRMDDDDDEGVEEVYGLEGLGSDEDEEEEELSDDDIMGEDEEGEEEVEDKTWGQSKKAYYNAEDVSDLEEMREEEKEALKIQKERLAAMDEADFVDDSMPGWGLGNEQDSEADKQLVDTVSKELEDISFDVSKTAAKRRDNLPVAEKIKILQNESPELLDLLNEFKEKASELETMAELFDKIRTSGKSEDPEGRFFLFKQQLLLNYMTNVSFYFALKASGVPNVRDHPVIHALVELRGQLEKLDKIEEKIASQLNLFVEELFTQAEKPKKSKKTKNATTTTTPTPTAKKSKKKASPVVEEPVEDEDEDEDDNMDAELDELIDIEEEFKSLKKANKKRKRTMTDDFGELEALDEVDMEDKLAKKKSIRDYVAKIDSKQLKMAAKYHGDSDLPYRDNNKYSKTGVRQPLDNSADLDGADWDAEDNKTASAVRNGTNDDDEDNYYEEVAGSKAAKKEAKLAEYEAGRVPIVDGDFKVEDGHKRLASYQILKNKGLTPHRRKTVRNTRVKHRNKFEKQVKKLSSVKQIVKEQHSGYGGESTGIKTNVARSVKLSQ